MMALLDRQKVTTCPFRLNSGIGQTGGYMDGRTDGRTEWVKQYRAVHAWHTDGR